MFTWGISAASITTVQRKGEAHQRWHERVNAIANVQKAREACTKRMDCDYWHLPPCNTSRRTLERKWDSEAAKMSLKSTSRNKLSRIQKIVKRHPSLHPIQIVVIVLLIVSVLSSMQWLLPRSERSCLGVRVSICGQSEMTNSLMGGFFLETSLGVQCVAPAGECAHATESLIFKKKKQ